jgi:hypothetical protein
VELMLEYSNKSSLWSRLTNSKKINDPRLNSLVNEYNDLFHGLGQIYLQIIRIKLN